MFIILMATFKLAISQMILLVINVNDNSKIVKVFVPHTSGNYA